ncbi:MAG: hypothetical protein JWN97_2432 [Nocardioides sp.]|nr:hypothetical protein [Nocardioides sp.]
MTARPEPRPQHRPMILPFPQPGELVRLAYWELHVAANGTPAEQKALGPHSQLPRPWEPSTCTDPRLRHQVWEWLEQVVIWLNHEYTWGAHALVPPCWPEHPHLIHEIAVIADQRRRSVLAKTSDALEEWHRYCLPTFVDRMQNRLRGRCDDAHAPWPGRPSHSEYTATSQTQRRQDLFAEDANALSKTPSPGTNVSEWPRLVVVDRETGEVIGDGPDETFPRTRTTKGPHE